MAADAVAAAGQFFAASENSQYQDEASSGNTWIAAATIFHLSILPLRPPAHQPVHPAPAPPSIPSLPNVGLPYKLRGPVLNKKSEFWPRRINLENMSRRFGRLLNIIRIYNMVHDGGNNAALMLLTVHFRCK